MPGTPPATTVQAREREHFVIILIARSSGKGPHSTSLSAGEVPGKRCQSLSCAQSTHCAAIDCLKVIGLASAEAGSTGR